MILYSTVLRIQDELTRDVFLRTAFENAGTNFLHQLISDLPESGIKELFPSSSRKSLVIATCRSKGLTALRYTKTDKSGHHLFREYVLDERNKVLSIQTGIKNFAGRPDYSLMRKCIPQMIHRLVDKRLLATDSIFPVSNNPTYISKDDDLNPIELMIGSLSPQFPLLLITPSLLGRYPISPDKAAFLLTGIAHVVVVADQKKLKELKKLGCNFSHSHGSVTFYNTRTKEFSPVAFQMANANRYEQLLWNASEFANNHPAENVLTFDLAQNVILHEQLLQAENNCNKATVAQKNAEQKYQHLRNHLEEERQHINKEATEKALQEAEQIVSSYEEDIDALKDELYEKDLTLQGLKVENQRLRSHLDKGRIPVIYFGQEKEFYLGEIQDLLLSSLEDALEDLPEKSRKRDVITDILASNHYMHTSKDRNEQVKHLLKGYDGMSAKIRHGLEELGFTVEETNKHCKISYHEDSRYLVVFGSTPSDVRTGKNNAATLVRMAY